MLTAWEELTSPAPPRLRARWQPPRADMGRPPLDTLGDFSRALRAAGVADNRAVAVPGAIVLMPSGVRLAKRFRDVVESELAAAGIEEWEYPGVLPTTGLTPTREVLDLDGRILYAATDRELTTGAAATALGPSGEAAIYCHWHSLVRTEQDLPIRMYQRARYFRPASRGRHSGRSVFRALESRDVYEVHEAHADADGARAGYRDLFDTWRRIAGRCNVPVVWTTRPRATNHADVADESVAGDGIVPVAATTQLATLYRQGDRFARAFDVGFGPRSQRRHAQHISGSMSRRTLFAHLLVAMAAVGRLTVHPELAVPQVIVVSRPDASAAQRADSEAVTAALRASGFRAEHERCVTPAHMRAILRREHGMAAPVELLMLAGKPEETGPQFRARRPDGHELVVQGSATGVAEQVKSVLTDVARLHEHAVASWSATRVRRAGSEPEARGIVDASLVAVFPVTAGDDSALAIGRWGVGEVLGYARSPELGRCILDGSPTQHVAIAARRT